MPRAATDVMQSVIFAAVADALDALRTASRGVPNIMLRDIQSVHRNATFADLPKELQDAISNSVRSAFTMLLKEGYAVAPAQSVQTRSPARVPDGERRRPPSGPRGGRTDPRGGRGPRPGGAPRKPPS